MRPRIQPAAVRVSSRGTTDRQFGADRVGAAIQDPRLVRTAGRYEHGVQRIEIGDTGTGTRWLRRK
jgi:hypothetical protein